MISKLVRLSLFWRRRRFTPSTPIHDLVDYLQRYLCLKRPGFAVLVVGPWGCGKTYQVKRALGRICKRRNYHYVSLFGLASPDDVIAAVYSEMFPQRGTYRRWWKNLSGAQAFGLSLGTLHSLAAVSLRTRVDTSRPIVFDDLERSPIDFKLLLGIINHYVEAHGCHVIVLCNEDQLAQECRPWQEKVFGQTIHLEASAVEAFDRFMETIIGAHAVLPAYRDVIIDRFEASGAHSLRILRHVMETVVWLLRDVDPRFAGKTNAMREMVEVFAALSFEVRAIRLVAADLRNRGYSAASFNISGDKTKYKPPIVFALERHLPTDLASEILSDQLLIAMLFDARYAAEQLNDHLARTVQFSEPVGLPAWRKVSGHQRLDDAVVEEGINELSRQFDGREVTEIGELLHIFALRFMLAAHGALKLTPEAVEAECREYIEALLASDRCPRLTSDEFDYLVPDDGAIGFTFWIENSYREHFWRVHSALRNATLESRSRQLRRAVPEVLDLVQQDGRKFFDELVHTTDGSPRYADTAVLHMINPAEFVAAFRASPPSGWYWIKGAIDERHKFPREDFEPEIAWVEEVRERMREMEQTNAGFGPIEALRNAQFIRSIPNEPTRWSS